MSLELGLPESQVKDIVDYQGTYTHGTIKAGEFEGVIWPYLGKIKAKIEVVQDTSHSKGALKRNQIQYPKSQTK